MEQRITATDLARRLGDVLGRVRDRGDSFLVEQNGQAVARLLPVAGNPATSLREGFAAWSLPERDPTFAGDLESVNRDDRPPDLSWMS